MPLPTRRSVLGASVLAWAGALAASPDAAASTSGGSTPNSPTGYVSPGGAEVAAAEQRRAASGGTVRQHRLTATESRLDLGERTVRSWSYGGDLPGEEIRVTAGDTLALTLANHLPDTISLHWHGIALRNDMDGVPGLTQGPIESGAAFDYRFTVPYPGTFWFHPHTGVQLDRGLYAPLIVDDPREPLSYDREWVVLLDDWVDGVDGSTPDAVLAELGGGMRGMDMGGSGSGSGSAGQGMSGMSMRTPGPASASSDGSGPSRRLVGARSDLLGGDPGDVAYPYYLVNGRTAEAPSVFRADPGDRIRIRLINAGGDTAFRVALGGHELTVTHTDGYPVRHAQGDALLIGMGERYDVIVTAGDGAFPLTALAEGKNASTMAVLRTGGGAAPTAEARPQELDGRLLAAHKLTVDESVALERKAPDRTIDLSLTGTMTRYDWAFDRKPYDASQRHPVRAGERVRLRFTNRTSMWHPIHLHGHTFALAAGDQDGVRKDTALVLPKGTLSVDFDADNPGLWMLHCHNVYHAEAGMMTVVGYQS
ncbi:multicopper oxidase family protein [Streptomyces sp. NPDC102394]|uniref:multicopper oxidase family protein n=1 Tax=Streptomyces sp. NPDC102394 TaxID=3366167 RepID=UPI0038272B02